jgi:hypothetical protein
VSSGRVYNKAMLAFLRANYPLMMVPELTAEFNKKFRKQKTVEQIKSCLTNHSIKAGVKRNRTPRIFLDEHLEFLQKHYLVLNLDDLTNAFNQAFPKFNAKVSQIRACLRNHKIRSGRTGHFEKGQESWNKGMQGLHLGGEKGWFKKGAVPLNYKKVGSERVNKDGYVEIKVKDPNKWKLKHRVIWEQSIGPIPKGKIIIFKDNNPLNCDIENLMMIERCQSMVMNKLGLNGAPSEVKETVLAIADLTILTNKRSKAA